MIGAALLLATLVAAPTPEAAIVELLPTSGRDVVKRLTLPGLPKPGAGITFHATAERGSTEEIVVAHLTARRNGQTIYARRITVPVRTRLRVPVPTRHLPRGAILKRTDIVMRDVHVPSPPLICSDIDGLVGQETRRPLTAGKPIPRRSVERRKIVARGDEVKVSVRTRTFRVVMDARALESGAVGDTVRVVNPRSNEIVSARVVGRGQLEVTP